MTQQEIENRLEMEARIEKLEQQILLLHSLILLNNMEENAALVDKSEHLKDLKERMIRRRLRLEDYHEELEELE